MKNLKAIIIMAISLIVFISSGFAQKCVYQEEGYTKLFNGKDLTGWKIPTEDNGHWNVIDGVIDYDARSEAEEDKSLWTENEYIDFQLHVEWRFKGYGDHLFPMPQILPDGEYLTDSEGKVIKSMQPNSDSGILLKGVGQTNLWCWSVGSGELWSVRNNKELTTEQRAAAIPGSNQDQPVGFWNAFDITVKGERITIKNNGVVVINNAYYPGLNVKGPIGFQHHGGVDAKTGKLKGASSLVQFRNVWIKEL